jgi:hypothetical protein
MAMPKDLPVMGRSYSECHQKISPKHKEICSLCVKKLLRQKKNLSKQTPWKSDGLAGTLFRLLNKRSSEQISRKYQVVTY